jgi:SWI/SNF-related matrix-associated actin-dependent regulator of chromatin subfamily A3
MAKTYIWLRSFEHVIAGTRSSRPEDEAVGGILADEMGLGKTLTMLAAVANSIQASQEFEAVCRGSFAKLPSRATLVVAPSARTYLLSILDVCY